MNPFQSAPDSPASSDAPAWRNISDAAANATDPSHLSHDLHTPLNGVLGMLELLLDSGLNPTQSRHVRMAQASAEELALRIDDLLDHIGAGGGMLHLESAAFDLRRETEAAVLAGRAAASGTGLALHTRFPAAPLPQVIGNPLRVRQLVSSLLANAIRSSAAGGILLELDATVENGLCHVTIAVTDGQSGKPRAHERSNSRSGMRSSPLPELDLSACKHLAELMGGGMNAQSESGSARTCRVTLPLPLAPGRFTAPDQHPTSASFAGCRVLVADDVEVNQQVVAQWLARLGCKVELAANGEQAVAMQAQQAFDLILMDCQMPDLDGYSATARIRTTESGRRTPIIAVTAYAMQGERERCMAAGMDDYLPKPVRLRNLLAALQRWLAPAIADDTGDELEEMRDMFGDDFTELGTLYLSDSPKRLAALNNAAMAADAASAASVVHSFAGSCASIGAPRLAEMCKELELRCRANNLDGIMARLDAIDIEYRRIEAKLNAMLQETK